jgi:hypothetical protein
MTAAMNKQRIKNEQQKKQNCRVEPSVSTIFHFGFLNGVTDSRSQQTF